MPRSLLLFLVLIPLLAASCYEDNIACLDLDATNYDILADQSCSDCCVYPTFSMDVDRFWADSAFLATDVYPDGAGNEIRVLNFRVYLTELELVAGNELLPTPVNEIEVGVVSGSDTVLTDFNANLVLLNTTGSTTSTVGRLSVGETALTQVQGRLGMAEDFPAIVPSSAPATSPLSTQEGLLNFNDGQGYLTASAQYLLVATNDTVRIDLYNSEPFVLDFPVPEAPERGEDLTLEFAADYREVFGTIDLTEDENTVADGIFEGLKNWLMVTGAR
ncbi:hypothetical protein FUA23_19125 [Neolewinella aurantiaca]|uniref:Uncharacterized protein n=1 Tax=Neolewinella aurantiaca TaxID=2602767 RepID=A0A5C7FK86_9BACT|nr:hypothetical protein [Neolewinella aurantiaca]TXF86694.1 hypothetical protein FUA23_19125 [Neolewinella aurantiaca]